MKIAILTAAALFATPLVAQTTPNMPTSAQNAPGTAPASSDQTTTAVPNDPAATTAPAAGADPTAAPAMQSGQPMQGGQPMANGQAMPNGQMPMAGDTPPATASSGNLPYCRQGQYTGCREHSNAAGARVHKKSMRKR